MTRPQRLSSDVFLPSPGAVRVIRQHIDDPVSSHWHEFYELYYTTSGSATHTVNGVETTLNEGSVFLLTPSDIHEIEPAPGSALRGFNVIFEKRLIQGEVERLLIDVPNGGSGLWAVDGFFEVEADFRRMWKEMNEAAPGQELVLENLLQCALVELVRRCRDTNGVTTPARGSIGDLRIRQALLYIDHHFREPLSLAAVASHVHLSPNYFSEHFHEGTGATFQSYLQSQRLRFARSLLSSTDLPVTEICYAAGFNDLSHFGRAFRRAYGASPSQYRKAGDAAPSRR